MIQQHFLQQQRLNYNHDRLLERFQRILTPKVTEFRTFGTSALPGRNYDQYLGTLHGGKSVITQSRAGVGSSSETYRLMGGRAPEMLPRNVNSMMQHTRSQPVSLVHAEKFEPVEVYEHPRFGPTPSYLRPIFNDKQHKEEDTDDNDSDASEEETENPLKTEHKEETKLSSTDTKNDDPDEPDVAPLGYISYKKWKAKYEHLIPVNPLLFSIYTRRRNGSINKYGQSLYASPPRHRRSSLDDDAFTPSASEIESIASETPHNTSLSSQQRYNRLHQPSRPQPLAPRRLEPIRTDDESSDDESSPPESPVPYLSRTRTNPLPSPPIIPLTTPITTTPFTSNTLHISPIGPSTEVEEDSKNTSNIPPAPPMPPSLATTSTTRYETPSSIPITSPPPAPPLPSFLTTSNSAASHQVPSNISVPPPPAPSVSESTTKAVTFAGVSSTLPGQDDVSSSSDSEDEEKQKRRRRRKRQAAGGGGDDSSSSDD